MTGRPSAFAYAWWLVVGVLAGLGVLALLTIGLPLLTLAVVLAVAGGLWRRTANSAAALVPAGLAVPVLYLAWLNRDGPGDVCRSYADGGSVCEEQWSPWPFVVVAVALVAGSVVLLLRLLRASQRS